MDGKYFTGQQTLQDTRGREVEVDLWRGSVRSVSGPDVPVTFLVGAENSNVIAVTIRLPGAYATAIISITDAPRGGLTSVAPSGGIVAGVGRIQYSYTTDKHLLCIADSSGRVCLNITEVGAKTFYMAAIVNGTEYMSKAITFA